jgi:antitoxin (DNA-binding transcriptional repressor) of toxin-antitoxin stability system
MTVRIDLDDLPPKVAAQLAAAAEGEEVLLVQGGAVVSRLTAGLAVAAQEPEPPASPEEHAAEVFEQFRSAIEEEF